MDMIVEEYKGYTIETDQRNPYAQKDEVEYMFYPTKEGIQDDMDCTDGESFTYCGNCKWASTIEEAYDEIDELTYDDMKVHGNGAFKRRSFRTLKTKTMEPDFKVRNLEDYTWDELETLQWAIVLAKIETALDNPNTFQKLDVWLYRIKDAMAVARKRENETH